MGTYVRTLLSIRVTNVLQNITLNVTSYIASCVGNPMKPVVVVQPGQLINLTVYNFNLSMQCGHYNKDFDYHWEKKDEQIHLTAQGINSHQLKVSNLTPNDSGEYRCAMSNSTGKIFSDYILMTVKGVLS